MTFHPSRIKMFHLTMHLLYLNFSINNRDLEILECQGDKDWLLMDMKAMIIINPLIFANLINKDPRVLKWASKYQLINLLIQCQNQLEIKKTS